MIQTLAVLYSFGAAVIAGLGFLARSNRKSGWVKRRNSVFGDLLALQAHWDEMDARTGGAISKIAVAAPAAPVRVARAGDADFSSQLVKMQRALARAAVEVAEPVEQIPA